MRTAIDNALDSYFDRVIGLSGYPALLTAVGYLTDHPMLGGENFITVIAHSTYIDNALGRRVLAIVNAQLTVDFSEADIKKSDAGETSRILTYSYLYWLFALASKLGVANRHLEELLRLLTVKESITSIRSAGKVEAPKKPLYEDLETNARFTIHQIVLGTQADIRAIISDR